LSGSYAQEADFAKFGRLLVHGLRDSVASISSQSELAQNLIANQISGSTYLDEIADETDEPLLILPT